MFCAGPHLCPVLRPASLSAFNPALYNSDGGSAFRNAPAKVDVSMKEKRGDLACLLNIIQQKSEYSRRKTRVLWAQGRKGNTGGKSSSNKYYSTLKKNSSWCAAGKGWRKIRRWTVGRCCRVTLCAIHGLIIVLQRTEIGIVSPRPWPMLCGRPCA